MKTENIIVKPNTLVILSGLPGSGKSTLRHTALGLPDEGWVSSDEIRERIHGVFDVVDESGTPRKHRLECSNEAVFAIMAEIVRARLRHHLPTVVDATNILDRDRGAWASIAAEYGAQVLVVIMEAHVEACLEANEERLFKVPATSIRNMAAAFNEQYAGVPAPYCRYSRHPFVMAHRATRLVFEPCTLDSAAVDIIGDTHGLLEKTRELVVKAGWTLDAEDLPIPPESGRKLLFLGDLVDRGPQSVELLQWVRKAQSRGVALAILGNHEDKLLRFLRTHAQGKPVVPWPSKANAETGMAMLKLPEEERNALVRYLESLPTCVVLRHASGDFAFVHGNVASFVPLRTPSEVLVYGERELTGDAADALYQQRFDAGLNTHTLFRGHIPGENRYENVFSLEGKCFQNGELMLLPLDRFIAAREEGLKGPDAFGRCLVRVTTGHDFNAYKRVAWEAGREMERLEKLGLVRSSVDPSGVLRVFKYAKRVFWENGWGQSDWLLKARGLVLDPAGAVVSHPFDKCFNYGENDAGKNLPADLPVVVPLKMNGFLGCVTSHPVRRGELLPHTQGGFDSQFTGYIQDYLKGETGGRIKKYLAKNNVTLMFEVIHPEDPHIIEYAPRDQGLWLIGVRGKRLQDTPWTEEEVDKAAQEMGLRRVPWERTVLNEVLGRCARSEEDTRVEGWMVRADTPEQPFLFKLKTPYYLTTKFLGRLSSAKVKHMYGSPQNFKQTVDEEFYPLVDALVARFDRDHFLKMEDNQRVTEIRALIGQLM